MPSPLAHLAAGYAIYRSFKPPTRPGQPAQPARILLLTTAGFSLLPDLDAALGVALNDFARFHNNITHSLAAGLLAALALGALAERVRRSSFLHWFSVGLLCYEAHVIMDYFTSGRGVMLFWPWTSERYSAAIKLFYGLHWSKGWISADHLWTLATEFIFVGIVVTALHIAPKVRLGKSAVLGSLE